MQCLYRCASEVEYTNLVLLILFVIQDENLFVQLITLHHAKLKLTLNRKHDEHLLHLKQ